MLAEAAFMLHMAYNYHIMHAVHHSACDWSGRCRHRALSLSLLPCGAPIAVADSRGRSALLCMAIKGGLLMIRVFNVLNHFVVDHALANSIIFAMIQETFRKCVYKMYEHTDIATDRHSSCTTHLCGAHQAHPNTCSTCAYTNYGHTIYHE